MYPLYDGKCAEAHEGIRLAATRACRVCRVWKRADGRGASGKAALRTFAEGRDEWVWKKREEFGRACENGGGCG